MKRSMTILFMAALTCFTSKANSADIEHWAATAQGEKLFGVIREEINSDVILDQVSPDMNFRTKSGKPFWALSVSRRDKHALSLAEIEKALKEDLLSKTDVRSVTIEKSPEAITFALKKAMGSLEQADALTKTFAEFLKSPDNRIIIAKGAKDFAIGFYKWYGVASGLDLYVVQNSLAADR